LKLELNDWRITESLQSLARDEPGREAVTRVYGVSIKTWKDVVSTSMIIVNCDNFWLLVDSVCRKLSILIETTACQIWYIFIETQCRV